MANYRKLDQRICEHCEQVYQPNRRNQRFCANCKTAGNNLRRHRYVKQPLPPFISCVCCNTQFTPKRRDAAYCSKECAVKFLREEFMRIPEYREMHKKGVTAWQRANPEKTARYDRASRYRRWFGITLEDFEALVESQGSHCIICNVVADLVPDHDHITGTFRGAICSNCNTALGLMADNPEWLISAAMYLIRNGESSVNDHLTLERTDSHS